MPFSRLAENRIREAMADGHFENLPGAGQPLNLDEYFNTPEDLRMAYSILRNARCAPPEVELLNEIARLLSHVELAQHAAQEQRRVALEDGAKCRGVACHVGGHQLFVAARVGQRGDGSRKAAQRQSPAD